MKKKVVKKKTKLSPAQAIVFKENKKYYEKLKLNLDSNYDVLEVVKKLNLPYDKTIAIFKVILDL